MDNHVLSVNNITKRIGKKEIIKGISFRIDKGEVFGFLGPNGAGKSTTLRMIVGLLRPTSGNIAICGHSITKNFIKAMSNVGCIIEEPDLYNYATGMKNLEMLGYMSKNISRKDIMDAVELVGMEKRIGDKVSTYSRGMKQRIGLAQALLHNPKLLVLDEPTNGLDPQGIFEFREMVKDLASEKNISVLVSSHLISEIQLMCSKVSIIKDGLVVKTGAVNDLVSSSEVYWVVDNLEKGKLIMKERFKINAKIINNRLEAVIDLNQLEIVNALLVNEGLKLKYVNSKSKTLEELFLSLTENQKIT
jgi:ABC-2 type transport system ATP-binding protein